MRPALRVKDPDFARRQTLARNGKGMQDRVPMLPESLIEPLQIHPQQVTFSHEQDPAAGYGSTRLPYALARKYPNADEQWAWQYVFPRPKDDGLVSNSLMHRYDVEKSADGLMGKEGTFSLCTFWLVEALTRAGRSALAFRGVSGACAAFPADLQSPI